MDWATAAAIVSDRTPDLSDAPDAPGDDDAFWAEVEQLVNGDGDLSEAGYQHKDTPESFWERMRAIHGPDYGPRFTEALHPRDRSGKWMAKLGLKGLREVGGAPRDDLLGKHPKDVDYMAMETPERIKAAVEAAGGKAEPLMVRDRLVGVRATHPDLPDGGVEIVPPRVEESTGEGRKDFAIIPHPGLDGSESPERMTADDAMRRDFTVNAIYRDPETGELTDPTGHGVEDARHRVLRMVHDQSFQEDPLRMLRGARFAAQHALEPEPATLAAMRRDSGGMTALTQKGVSGTVQEELRKILMSDNPGVGLRLMRDTGMLQTLLPELAPIVGFDQRSMYHEHVLDEHTFEVVDELARQGASYEARLAALFHDSGKPLTAHPKPDGTFSFHSHPVYGSHQDVGADIARTTLKRLNFPRETIDHVSGLVREHMVTAVEKPTPVKARRLRARFSDKFLKDLLDHKAADMEGHGTKVAINRLGVQKLRDLLAENADAPRSVKDLMINGDDLIAAGVQPGPELGKILKQLLTEVINQPDLNRREWLLGRAEKLAALGTQEWAELEEASIYTEVLHPRDRLGRWLQKTYGHKDTGQDYRTMVHEAVRLRYPQGTPHEHAEMAKVVLREVTKPRGMSATTASTRGGGKKNKRTPAEDAIAELKDVTSGWELAPSGEYRPTGGLRARWLEKLNRIATEAHAGQEDKQQRPYIEHVHAVADSVTDEAKPVALFHDALEDTQLTPEALKAALTEPRVTTPEQAQEMVDAIKLLTRPVDDTPGAYERYIQNIKNADGKAGELAREVKRADLLHNIGRSVLPGGEVNPEFKSLREKYQAALDELTTPHEQIPQRGVSDNLTGLDEELVRQRFRDLIKKAQDRGVADEQLQWYSTAHNQIQAIALDKQVDPHVLAAMVAATSPQMTWDLEKRPPDDPDKYPNLVLAVRAINAADEYPNMPAPELVDHLLAINELGGLGKSVEKAIRIYRGEDPDRVLNAPKTRSFYNNLAWPDQTTTATIDLHMARATLGKTERKNYATGDEGILNEKAAGSGYRWVADRVAEVADEMHVMPHQAQAVIWVQQKFESDEAEKAEKAAAKAAKAAEREAKKQAAAAKRAAAKLARDVAKPPKRIRRR